ncbi:hypothetical protein ACCS60_08705 [Rhizobium acaciae]|uniref:hypothetical protein n=1 Tax=Rhizobium acaciae TaxID=2989736 RepID=UPI003F99EF72
MPAPSIAELLKDVPDDVSWQTLEPSTKAALEERARIALEKERQAWGLAGLAAKRKTLLEAPTPAMTENINTVLAFVYNSELSNGFDLARDVQNADLKAALINIYLATVASRGFLIYNHPEFKGWDGLPIHELPLVDDEGWKASSAWLQRTEDDLRQIPPASLTPLESAFLEKSYFSTRAGKFPDKPPLGTQGAMEYAGLYSKPASVRPIPDDATLLEAYNASMFSEFRDFDVGTLDAFWFNYDTEFKLPALKAEGMSNELAATVLKLGKLYLTRTQGNPDKDRRCTIYSSEERNSFWDSFTAGQISNADGSESIEEYQVSYRDVAAKRLSEMRELGSLTLERMFPDGSAELSASQRSEVTKRLLFETRPAKMMDTLITSLDEVTGSKAASQKVLDAANQQPTVGGGYVPDEEVRASDRAEIMKMWDKLRAYIKAEYSGYRLDIAQLIPVAPIIQTSGDYQFTGGGKVTLSLGSKQNLASFSSTFMHEMKHAIDQNSHAAVEGAAWEGAATSVEHQVWPIFIEKAMADQLPLLPIARLKTAVDNVRFTATTDATLSVFLRETCGANEPNTIDFVKEIVRSYGYDEPDTLTLRSRRAHRSTQYLMYDYGLAQYTKLLAYLQNAIGPATRVDAFLLQACKMPSPNADQATIDNLRACISERKM